MRKKGHPHASGRPLKSEFKINDGNVLDNALANHVVRKTCKGLDADDIGDTRAKKLCHFSGEKPSFTVLITDGEEGFCQIGDLFNVHRSFETAAVMQCLKSRLAESTDGPNTGARRKIRGLTQKLMLINTIIEGVIHKIHQVGNMGFRTFTLQQFYQMIVGNK